MEEENKQIIIYKTADGKARFDVQLKDETVWLNQKQMAELFDKDRKTITEHIGNVFKEKELIEKTVCRKFQHTAPDGKNYDVNFYNLDVIISVGYRVKSLRGTQFRIWATNTLKQHLTQGYTLNKKRISQNYNNFLKAVDSVKKLLPKEGAMKSEDTLELMKMFASTWFSLDAYDKSNLPLVGTTKKQVKITAQELVENILELKKKLISKKEASRFFAQEKQDGDLEGIVGNIFQSIFGKDVYLTLEEKAAHLLYFIVKNHPFVDGNKRSGAFAFIWFLQKTNILNTNKLTPEALTALTLLVAESNPKEKERMIGLILLLLKK